MGHQFRIHNRQWTDGAVRLLKHTFAALIRLAEKEREEKEGEK